MKNDLNTSLQELRKEILNFREERDWTQFSDPYDLVAALSVEANELLELFLWKKPSEVQTLLQEKGHFLERLSEEIADVMAYCLLVSHSTGIDLSNAVVEKMKKNRIKYPIEQVKGKRVDKSIKK